MKRLTNSGTKEAKSNVTIKEVCDKLADFEDLEESIGIPLKEIARIFRQHIPDGCQHPQKAIVLTDGDVDKWREYKAFEKDGRLLKVPRLGEQEKCRECVHTRASCHHRELKCSECPMTELFCDEFYVAIDICHEEAYASGYLAGIEVEKYKAKSLENDNWEIGYLVKNQEWAYIVKPLDNGMFDFITVDPKTVCKFAEIKNPEKGIPTVYAAHKVMTKLEEEKEYAFADFEAYVNDVSPCLDAEYDDLFHRGLERAIEIVKENIDHE